MLTKMKIKCGGRTGLATGFLTRKHGKHNEAALIIHLSTKRVRVQDSKVDVPEPFVL
jgi:hypothetical protein